MNKIIKNFAFSIFAILILGGMLLWHYLDIRFGANKSGDFWILDAYKVIGLICILFVFISMCCIHFYKADEMVTGYGKTLFSLKIEQSYFLVLMMFGLLYMIVLPPLSAPDEISHYITSYRLSNQLLFMPATDTEGYVLVRESDWFLEDIYGEYIVDTSTDGTLEKPLKKQKFAKDGIILGQTLEEEDYDALYRKGFQSDRGQMRRMAVTEYENVNTTPIAYFPQALGISLARVLELGVIPLVFMGRFFNLLAVVVITTLAMKRLPFGKEIYFGVHLLPMSLHLMASFSYDAFVIAMYGLYISYCLHLAYKAEKVRKRDIAILALIMAMVAPCKIVYVPLSLVAFLIPIQKFGKKRYYFLSAFIVLLAIGISMAWINFHILRTYATIQDTQIVWAGEPGHTLSSILNSKKNTLRLIYNTFSTELDFYHITLLGGFLGNLDQTLYISDILVIILTLCLMGLCFARLEEPQRLGIKSRFWIGFIILLCIGLIEFSMLIAWTPLSSKTIMGVQGRYFLPMLPLFILILRNHWVVFTRAKDRILLTIMCLCNALILIRMMGIICSRFVG